MIRASQLLDLVRLAAAVLALAAPALAQDAATQREETLFVREQQSFTPGYAVGNIAIGDPAVADFRVLAGRRELLLFGRGPGKTTLTIWDQRNVKRDEVLVVVITREDFERERDLRELLKPYPDVQLRKLGSSLVISGTAASRAELDAIAKIAAVGGAQNLVTLAGVSGTPMPTPTGTPGATTRAAAPTKVRYEVELYEAAIGYQSGSYATGVEPSGRTLFKHVLEVGLGAEEEVYIPGTAARAKSTDAKRAAATGLRLRIRPGEPAATGEFSTYILVETNLPLPGGPYDPNVWRRARWEFSGLSGEPLGLAGNELLATAVVDQRRGSKLGRIVSTVTGLGGIVGAPGTEYGAAMPYFDKDKRTQLVVVLRPRIDGAAR